MKYICFKYFHWFLPWFPIFYYKKKTFSWKIKFDENYTYDIGQDQSDWNKVVGISEYFNPRKKSWRLVNRWNIEKQVMELAAFYEENKKFTEYPLGDVPLDKSFIFNVFIEGGGVVVKLNDKSFLLPKTSKKFFWRCNPYFGGNRSATKIHCLEIIKGD